MAAPNEQVISKALVWGLLKPLYGSYCFTGKHSENRVAMETMIRLLGGVAHNVVTDSTNYLVVPNESNPQSSKAQAARRKGTMIITEAELCAMIFPTLDELLQ